MLEYSRWKYAVLLIVVLVSALYALPNIYPQDPSVQIAGDHGAKIDDPLKKKVAETLAKAGIKPTKTQMQGEKLLVRIGDVERQKTAADALREALGDDYVVAQNLASTVPSWLSWLGGAPMSLGLDLQGGVHFQMEVDRKAALDKRFEIYLTDIRSALRDAGVDYDSVERNGERGITIQLNNAAQMSKAKDIVGTLLRQSASNANTGTFVSPNAFQFTSSDKTMDVSVSDEVIQQLTLNAIEQNISTLRNRIGALGEPVIQRQGAERVIVQLPGVQDTAEAKRMLGATATLEYRAVIEGDAAEAERTGSVPPGAKLYYQRNPNGGKPFPILLSKRIIVSGDDMKGADATTDQQSGQPAVAVELSNAGGERMLQFTNDNVEKRMAVVYIENIPQVSVVDGKEVRTSRVKAEVISAAQIKGVFGSKFQTTGLQQDEAQKLSKLLKAGALAAPMYFVEERTVGPSLGRENIRRGVTAVLFSFVFVLAFFLVYYRMFGLITCIALLVNLLMVVALMSIGGATMSLPGLAGIALTVGMSVDANVLINERIREELRAGLPPQKAISEGYDRASGTILDANVTAFLVGLVMSFFSGPLQAFGITTMLGIVTSAYTAVSMSRGIATLIYGGRRKLQSIAI